MPHSDFGKTFFGDEAEKESHQRTDHARGNGQVQERGNCGNHAIDADDTEDDAEDNVEERFHFLCFFGVTPILLQILCQTGGVE